MTSMQRMTDEQLRMIFAASCIEAVSEGSAGYRTCRQLQGGMSAGGRDCA